MAFIGTLVWSECKHPWLKYEFGLPIPFSKSLTVALHRHLSLYQWPHLSVCLSLSLSLSVYIYVCVCACVCYGTFNITQIWFLRKNKKRSTTFKYVYIRSAIELLKHIPLVANSLLENKLKLKYTYLWLVNVLLSFCIFSGCV